MKRTPEDLVKIKQDEYLSFYRYIDIETNEELGDGTTLVFIEMNKFQKQFQECHLKKEKWLCSLKNMKGLLEVPEGINGTELEALYSRGEIAALPKSKKLNYISYIMSRNDELNSRAEQIADAREEGRQEGRQEGRRKERAEIVRSMYSNGMNAEDICRIVNISIAEVKEIIS